MGPTLAFGRRVPLDAAQGKAGDAGEAVPPASIAGQAWKQIVDKIIAAVEASAPAADGADPKN